MRKVLVIGSGGSGKSWLASRIGARTGLPVVHLDTLYWREGWVPTPAEEWARVVGELAARDAWVMDGNYSGTIDIRLRACDTVVFLDLPRLLCLWRIVARRVRFGGRARPDVAAGCREQLTWEFVRWVWTYPRRRRPRMLERLRVVAGEKRVVVLRSAAAAERFLATLGGEWEAPCVTPRPEARHAP